MLGVFKILYFRNYFFLNVYVFFFYLLVGNKLVRKYEYKIIVNQYVKNRVMFDF